MPDIQMGDVATWVATAVAIASAFAAARASKAADKYQAEAAQCARRSADLLEKNHQLSKRSWTDQHFDAVRAWADQVCCAVSEATHLVEQPQPLADAKKSVLVRLSTLIDTGRWYFPNQWNDDYGLHKESAYRGIRQPVLDCIVTAYNELRSANADSDANVKIVAAQREFVSHIQTVLNPRAREQEIKKILDEFEVSERLRNAPGELGG
ncbi:hypothetical protein R69619_00400 [Paraburkholderia nemoris]|uniref:hypothetical protein n=1 Tax=Paraburkholderia nemoris TaxID=2793076 RepID=UPI00190E0F22|nr:hypothetical protein [Paraburkholderia nemoris]MBK3737665.1 hypothetical protein [Paraburkholderia aspalathi]CAE6694265.1 hypothetical protein R69619_00400 [Paraburkholderia nemoris]